MEKQPPATDEEIICTWMEPKPEPPLRLPTEAETNSRWWKRVYNDILRGWEPHTLTLDALWEVEERLLMEHRAITLREYRIGWHATPAQKVKALAAVLRPLVEGDRNSPK